MSFVLSTGLTEEAFAGKYIFPDNDFLSVLFSDYSCLEDTLAITKRGSLLIDPLTKFEFLQTVYLPEQRTLKEAFISADNVFLPSADHQTIFSQIRDNAYTLSYLYGHHGCKGASVVDLFLAGRAVLHNPNAIILTGNRKDFPAFVFDLIGVFSREEKNGDVRSYSVIAFNKSKYDEAERNWRALK